MHFIHSDYKTIQVSFHMIEKDDVKKRAYRFLLSKMLSTHTNRHQTKQQLQTHLQDLYGASLSGRTSLIANLNVMQLGFVMVNPMIVDDASLFDQMLSLFKDMLFDRKFFSKQIFDHEKRMLIEQWESVKDQKGLYAKLQFNKHFFDDHPYGYPMSGTLEDIKSMTLDDMYAYFQDVIKTNQIDIIINGYVKDHQDKIESYFESYETNNHFDLSLSVLTPNKYQEVFEYLEMQQAVIYLGYHLPVLRNDKYYDAALCFNMIVGGYAESILFKEIREKQGFCYDVRSQYDPLQATFVIKSGVDLSRKKEAIDAFQSVINDLVCYGLNEEALTHAKASIIHQLKSSYDSQSSMTLRAFFDMLYNQSNTLDEKIDMISSVTLEDVMHVYHLLKHQVTYVISGDKNDN